MKVLTITAFTPSPENKGGLSALIYHLIVCRPQEVQMDMYSFNVNNLSATEIADAESSLDVKVHLLKQSPVIKTMLKHGWLHKLSLLFLKYPLWAYQSVPEDVIETIRKGDYDFVWIYPYFYFRIAKNLPDVKFVISGVDCISQVCTRRMENDFFLLNKKRFFSNMYHLWHTVNAEKDFGEKNIFMHYVGFEDMKFYKYLHRRDNAFFLLHPHYETTDKPISFDAPKLRILIAGKNDFYMKSDADRLIDTLVANNDITDFAEITFLGKGWEQTVKRLTAAGYDCKQIAWVDNYVESIAKYDIQISPISVGSGTKGKVLDAFANGLLVIGSKFALENICVRNNDSCIAYKYVEEIPRIIKRINANRHLYEQIAEKGRRQVRTYHSPERCGKRFFEISYNIK